MQSAHSPKLTVAYPLNPRTLVRRCLVAGAVVLVLGSATGCVAPALYALPCVLESAAVVVARSLPIDDHRMIADSPRPADEPALAQLPDRGDDPGMIARIDSSARIQAVPAESAAPERQTLPLTPVASAVDTGPRRSRLPVP